MKFHWLNSLWTDILLRFASNNLFGQSYIMDFCIIKISANDKNIRESIMEKEVEMQKAAKGINVCGKIGLISIVQTITKQ